MPQVVVSAAGAALVSGFSQGFTAAVLAKSFFGSLLLGGLQQGLAKKPKKPQEINQVSSNTFAIRQAAATRKHVYGHTRMADVYAHLTTTGNNEKLHGFVVLCDDEIESIDEVWVNDYVIPPDHLDAEGNVIAGRYAGYLRIRKHLGASTQVADPVAVAEIPEWTSEMRGQGVAYLYITLTKNQDLFPTGLPNFSAIIRGRKLFDVRSGASRFSPNCGLFVHDYLGRADYGFEALEADIDSVNMAAQANIADEIVDTEAVDMTLASVATGTDIITLSGDRLLFELGDRVEIVTAGTAPGGTATSTGYYVIPYQMKDTPRLRLATTLDNAVGGVYLDLTSAGTGAITIRKTGEPRYHGAGVVDTADEMGNVLNDMLNSLAGRAVNAGGAWRLLAGAWREPEIEIGIGDLRGPISLTTAIPMAERQNSIKGLFISSLNNYQEADFPAARYQTFIDEDNGQEYPGDLNLPMTNRPTTAQRIAKIELFRNRQEQLYTLPCSMKAFQLQAGDTMLLNIDRTGDDAKPFEVTKFRFFIAGKDDPVLMTELSLRETAEEIYDWSSGEAITYDPAPNSTLSNPFNVLAVTGLAFSSRAIESTDGDTIYSLGLAWDAHPDAFVKEYGDFEVQFKLAAEAAWRPSFFVDGALTFADVLTSSVNVQYDLRIRARNNLGVRSGWTTIANATAGSSGGVTATNDWEGVADSVGTSLDWGAVNDSVGSTDDWGAVV